MNRKTYIGIGLIVMIIAAALFLIFNWNTAFTQTMKIKYSDGCVEVYKGGNLTTPECTAGRMIEYQRQLAYNNTQTWPGLNITVS